MTPKDIIDQTNAYRVSVGLKPLKVSPELTKAAEAAGKDMSSKGYFAHNSPDGTHFTSWADQSGYSHKYLGQNLANGYNTATDTLKAWKASPEHNANLTKSQYTDIGVGFATGTYQGKPSTYVIQYFGSPDAPIIKSTMIPAKTPALTTKTPTPHIDSAVSHTTLQH